MTHLGWIRQRLSRSLRVRVGVLVLALVALPAIFAEVIAAPAPILAAGEHGLVVFPAVIPPAEYAPGWGARRIEEHHAGDFTIWPIFHHGPDTVSARGPDAPSSGEHLLGTDSAGRDVFVRLVYGARVALGIAAVALVLSLFFGLALGGVAGYFGGFWDELLARPIEVVETFPSVFVVAIVRAVYPDGSIWSLAIAVAAVKWAEVARLVRAEVVRTSSADFIVAARALGSGHVRILTRHILPVALRPALESALFSVASVVILEVSVSFLGLGPDVSWGATIADGVVPGHALTPTLWAGAALLATVGSAHLLADAIGEAVDARVATTRE